MQQVNTAIHSVFRRVHYGVLAIFSSNAIGRQDITEIVLNGIIYHFLEEWFVLLWLYISSTITAIFFYFRQNIKSMLNCNAICPIIST
jgi:hypothetical protein